MESYMMPGFRFYPTEEELVSFYLPKKIEGKRGDLHQVMPELYIYEFNPWDLPQFAGERCLKDPEQWFFFVPRQEKEVRGGRPNRLTTSGFWKATGSPGYVFSSDNRIIGAKRTMVFYKGRAPTGAKTEWKMNEYTAIDGESASTSLTATLKPREEFSLCRVYKRSKCLRAFDRRPSLSSSSSSAAVVTSTATISQAHDYHDVDHDWEATPYHNHSQNNHPTRERIITNSLVLTSSGDHTNPISQLFNPVHDNCHTDWATTTYHNHHQNDYPVMERTSPNQSSIGDGYAILNSQTFNEGHDDHNPDHAWAATAYHEHQNDHTVMERMITALPDQSSLWHHGNPNVQTLASAHEHPNCDNMSVDNSEDLCDFWEQLNFF